MIFNRFYEHLEIPKQRLHFNEFMINFHDFRFKNNENSIVSFAEKRLGHKRRPFRVIFIDVMTQKVSYFPLVPKVGWAVLKIRYNTFSIETFSFLVMHSFMTREVYRDLMIECM